MDHSATTPVAALADRQHGVVTRDQLLALGLTAQAINSRVRRGALRRLHPGVYALAHVALRDEGRWLAAVLASGEGAVLSHLSAARLWGLSSVPTDLAVHVTVPGHRRRLPGVVVHRARVTGADVTLHRGVPTTTVARTYVDLADELTYRELRRAADRGVRLDVAAVRRAQARAADRRGRGRLARLIGDDGGELRSRSGLERHARRLARAAGLATPQVNHRVLGHERDLVWPALRLVVELDGGAYHAPRAARETDHERDAELVLAGWRVLRFTDTQLDRDEDAVVATLRTARRAGPGGRSPQP